MTYDTRALAQAIRGQGADFCPACQWEAAHRGLNSEALRNTDPGAAVLAHKIAHAPKPLHTYKSPCHVERPGDACPNCSNHIARGTIPAGFGIKFPCPHCRTMVFLKQVWVWSYDFSLPPWSLKDRIYLANPLEDDIAIQAKRIARNAYLSAGQ